MREEGVPQGSSFITKNEFSKIISLPCSLKYLIEFIEFFIRHHNLLFTSDEECNQSMEDTTLSSSLLDIRP